MRLFVAVDFDSAAKAKMSELCDAMRKDGVAGNFTPQDNLHLTLKFLGEVSSAHISVVKAALDCAALTVCPFNLNFGHCGYFASRGEKTLWLGMEGDGLMPLCTLADTVDTELCKKGFEREKRAFTPHVTLARRAICNTDILVRIAVPEHEFCVNFITLFESRRDAGRLWYKPVYRSRLSALN